MKTLLSQIFGYREAWVPQDYVPRLAFTAQNLPPIALAGTGIKTWQAGPPGLSARGEVQVFRPVLGSVAGQIVGGMYTQPLNPQ